MRSSENQGNELVNYRILLVLQYAKFLLTIVLGLLFAFQYYKGSPPVVLAFTVGTLVSATALINLGAFCFLKHRELLLLEFIVALPYGFIWNGATGRGTLALYLSSWIFLQVFVFLLIFSRARYLKREDETNKTMLASLTNLKFERASATDDDTQ